MIFHASGVLITLHANAFIEKYTNGGRIDNAMHLYNMVHMVCTCSADRSMRTRAHGRPQSSGTIGAVRVYQCDLNSETAAAGVRM
jgi:hypothetical protein